MTRSRRRARSPRRLRSASRPSGAPTSACSATPIRTVASRSTRRRGAGTEFDVRGRADLPRVDIAASYAGADGAAIRAFVAAGARAIVSASLAPGVTTPAESEALLEAHRRGILVVVSSPAGSGRVLPRPVLREQGLVGGDH